MVKYFCNLCFLVSLRVTHSTFWKRAVEILRKEFHRKKTTLDYYNLPKVTHSFDGLEFTDDF